MSDRFSCIPLERLLTFILNEYWSRGSIFGIARENFFVPHKKDPFRAARYGQVLETPIGVAAGPQTQMAQNIITAWLTGSRYIELKTVQTLDELEISKPCIDMEDAGYNCEWSQELRLTESLDEYLNAWIIIHILRYEFGLESCKGLGGIFNMSAGYNLEGLLKPNVQQFFAKMQDCSAELAEKCARIKKIYPDIKRLKIPARMTDSITLSTMHGCPPDEIEKIGRYLIAEKKLNTTVKLNPTLVGAEMLRDILNTKLGFETNVPDEAFAHDLKYPDALALIKALTEESKKAGVVFNLKLTNTLESVNHRNVFPANEKMMYMSGRALHPISINLAARLQSDFAGALDISFSAGADCYNIADIIACGIRPVTVSSDMLKPGGYLRGVQYLENLAQAMREVGAKNIDEFILKRANAAGTDAAAVREAAFVNLKRYAAEVADKEIYRKSFVPNKSIKTARPLPRFDCVQAPCVTTCPGSQEIPEYLYQASRGRYGKAFEIIMRTNPLPTITGMVCDHLCMTRCTRQNYDTPLLIRDIKRFIVEQQNTNIRLSPTKKNGKKAAIIGAGPAGLSCAFYLALDGFAVTLYEAKDRAGGMAADAIPGFRLSREQIAKDIDRILALGVQIQYNQRIDAERFAKLREENDFVFVGIGAQVNKKMDVPGEDGAGVLGALAFLSKVRRGETIDIGRKVAVIGGGNSAMDAARTAFRLVQAAQGSRVVILYRRTQAEMPADHEEIAAVLEEKIEIMELVAPVSISRANNNTQIVCRRMQLGEPDASGRRRPVPIEGSDFTMDFDTIIPAIGQDTVYDCISRDDLKTDPATMRTKLPKVYAGGDAVHGPLNLITAIGDGHKAAEDMIAVSGDARSEVSGIPQFLRMFRDAANLGVTHAKKGLFAFEQQKKSATRIMGARASLVPVEMRSADNLVINSLDEHTARREAARCLACNDACNVCVTLCPNRANFSYKSFAAKWQLSKIVDEGGKAVAKPDRAFTVSQRTQTANIAGFCNECGNCATFCPTAGAPYKDKPKMCLTEESFKAEERGFIITRAKGAITIRARVNGEEESLTLKGGKAQYTTSRLDAVLNAKDFSVIEVHLKNDAMEHDLEQAAAMFVLLKSLAGSHLYG
ncbi:MAG: putative selenate reductase subunit YgfK [Spirochaetota bacterium]|jgi:putative selenate reductase|nr:putative selenate reductase subunit YgfK [Spirochaetota bacterium]